MRRAIFIIFLALCGCNGEIEIGDTNGYPPIVNCGKNYTLSGAIHCSWQGMPSQIPVEYNSGVYMENSAVQLECRSNTKQCTSRETGQIVGKFDHLYPWQSAWGFSASIPRGYSLYQTQSGRYVAVHPEAFKDEKTLTRWLQHDNTLPLWIEEDKRRAEYESKRQEAYAEYNAKIKRQQEEWEAETARYDAEQTRRNLQEIEKYRAQGVPTGLSHVVECEIEGIDEISCLGEDIPESRIDYSPLFGARELDGQSKFICRLDTKSCEKEVYAGSWQIGGTYHTAPSWVEHRFAMILPPGYIGAQTKSGKFIAYHQFAFKTDEEVKSYLESH